MPATLRRSRPRRSAPPVTLIPIGPWKGSMRSRSADEVPLDYLADSSPTTYPAQDYLWNPYRNERGEVIGSWKRRLGSTIKFDTFSTHEVTGLLPAKWGSDGNSPSLACGRARDLQEFRGDVFTDGIPTVLALVTKETMDDATVDDDGRFGTYWLRDQYAGSNYTLGADFSDSTYPDPDTPQAFRYIPLRYDSGDGGLTRAASSAGTAAIAEFNRRFLVPGSRNTLESGNWRYAPSLYGTPSRWDQKISRAEAQNAPTSASVTGNVAASSGTVLAAILDVGDAYIRYTDLGSSGSMTVHFPVIADPGIDTGFKFKFTLRSSTPCGCRMTMALDNASGLNGSILTQANQYFGGATATYPDPPFSLGNVTTSFNAPGAEYTLTLSSTEAAKIDFSSHLILSLGFATTVASTFDVDKIEFVTPLSDEVTAHLIPSGPLPPIHAGTLAATTQIENSNTYMRPDADITISPAGSWVSSGGGAASYNVIDETTPDNADYVQGTDAAAAGSYFEVSLSNLTTGVVVTADDTITVSLRYAMSAAAGTSAVNLVQGSTVISGRAMTPVTTSFQDFQWTLSALEIASITDFTDLRLRFIKTSGAGTGTTSFSYADVAHQSSEENRLDGGWRGSDKFYYSMAYVFEDDSIWMPCLARGKNALLASGFNLFQVDAGNATAGYQKVTWSNLPHPPKGVKKKLALRSMKIDGSRESDLALVDLEFFVTKVLDADVESFEDFNADDDALKEDPDNLLIRLDHIMTPRARYMFGGDSRACVSYGGQSPCAIILAPVSRASDTTYDLNLDEDDDTLYDYKASYMRLETDGTTPTLKLYLSDATGATFGFTKSFDLTSSSYDTLEKLVDGINATSISVDGLKWRAQLAPGATATADSSDSLLPHYRTIASCVVSGQTITVSGINKVAVGAQISGTGVTAGAYVTAINDDDTITFTGTITSGTKTLNFYFDLGDDGTTATAAGGYQRVLGSCLPGFLYFNNTYLNQTAIEKNSVWMTVASPGSVKSAPNCFSGEIANKFQPPLEAGISMGGAAVDNGFVIPFSKKNCVIRNTRDQGTGFDKDYKLFVLNEHRGCIAWQTVKPTSRAAVFGSAEGIVACDLFREHPRTLSRDIYAHVKSDYATGTGDFSYELPKCEAATKTDTDGAYLSLWVTRSGIWVNYRTSASTTHPNRQVFYDFSESKGDGLLALFRPDGDPWGWSLPLTRPVTAMCEGSRAGTGVDGVHLYGWNEQNQGSTGDGRIDELESAQTDNGTAITAYGASPWIEDRPNKLSFQAATVLHRTTTSSTVAFYFHRSRSDSTLAMSLSTGSAIMLEDRKEIRNDYRTVTDAGFFHFQQSGTGGSAQEVVGVVVEVSKHRRLRPA